MVNFYSQESKESEDFVPAWNKIVDEFSARYGKEQIEFLKVNGMMDIFTAQRYEVKSFPAFIVIEPASAGTPGVKYTTWTETSNRDFKGMKKWLKGFANRIISPLPDTPGFSNRVSAAKPESAA